MIHSIIHSQFMTHVLASKPDYNNSCLNVISRFRMVILNICIFFSQKYSKKSLRSNFSIRVRSEKIGTLKINFRLQQVTRESKISCRKSGRKIRNNLTSYCRRIFELEIENHCLFHSIELRLTRRIRRLRVSAD